MNKELNLGEEFKALEKEGHIVLVLVLGDIPVKELSPVVEGLIRKLIDREVRRTQEVVNHACDDHFDVLTRVLLSVARDQDFAHTLELEAAEFALTELRRFSKVQINYAAEFPRTRKRLFEVLLRIWNTGPQEMSVRSFALLMDVASVVEQEALLLQLMRECEERIEPERILAALTEHHKIIEPKLAQFLRTHWARAASTSAFLNAVKAPKKKK